MQEQTRIDLLRASIEEELGALRQFADFPATELEAIAARLARALAGATGVMTTSESRAA